MITWGEVYFLSCFILLVTSPLSPFFAGIPTSTSFMGDSFSLVSYWGYLYQLIDRLSLVLSKQLLQAWSLVYLYSELGKKKRL